MFTTEFIVIYIEEMTYIRVKVGGILTRQALLRPVVFECTNILETNPFQLTA
jgi:hypothetical protein